MADRVEEVDDAPVKKRARMDTIFTKFQSFSDISYFRKSYKQLCVNRTNALVSLEITYCDAAAEKGKPFSRATCHGKPVLNELFPFGSIFGRGVRILNNLLTDEKNMPDNEEDVKLLTPLLTFLFDEKSHECLKAFRSDVKNEKQVMTQLATHYFSKLSVSKSFMMDKKKEADALVASKKGSRCSCWNYKEKDITEYFGDTSIGHKDVWHGALDLILESCDIGVHFTQEPENISPGGRASFERKYRDLGSVLTRDHTLAQTITFSFLQKQQHSVMMDHSLIPFILASSREIQYFFYDCENDILLQSRKYPLFITVGDKLELSYQTIISTWFVLNYKYLCSGPTRYILDAPKAGFPKFAGPALKVYKSDLKFQNVCDTSGERRDEDLYDPTPAISEGRLDSCPFRWPEEPFVSCPFDIL